MPGITSRRRSDGKMTKSSNQVGSPHPVRIAMERHDIDAVLREFAPGFVLRSPVTQTPFDGVDSHRLLRVVLESYERWECLSEFGNGREHVLITRVRIAGRDVDLVDHMRHGPDGKVVDFTAYTRPLEGAATIARVVAPKIALHRSRPRALLVAALTRPAPPVIGLADRLISFLAAMHTRKG